MLNAKDFNALLAQDRGNNPVQNQSGKSKRDQRWENKRNQRQGLQPSMENSMNQQKQDLVEVFKQQYFQPPTQVQQFEQQIKPSIQYGEEQGFPSSGGSKLAHSPPRSSRREMNRQPQQNIQNSSLRKSKSPRKSYSPPENPIGNESNTFLKMNEGELQKKKYQEELRRQYIESQERRKLQQEQSAYQPAPRGNTPQIRNQIPMSDPKDDYMKKQQYRQELLKQQQIQNQLEDSYKRLQNVQDKKKLLQEKQSSGGYFPFGKPGAGAPMRNTDGQIIAIRPPRYDWNDTRFQNPGQFYQEKGVSLYNGKGQSFKTAANEQVPSYNSSDRFVQSDNQQLLPPGYTQQVQEQTRYPPESIPVQQSQVYQQQQQIQPQIMSVPSNQPGFSSSFPKVPDLRQSNEDLSRLNEAQKKFEYQRYLLEQMEERRRNEEEEKRKKILEERLEEERLAKQRLEMEMEFKQEHEKRKLELQRLERENLENVVIATQKRKGKRVRTPYSPPKEIEQQAENQVQRKQVVEKVTRVEEAPTVFTSQREHIVTEVPIEVTKKLQNQLDNEIWRLRNEMNHQSNDLKDQVIRLKNEAQIAQEQRYEAVKELERMKEDFRQRMIEEDIRQNELYTALVKNQVAGAGGQYFYNTKMPDYEKGALQLPKRKIPDLKEPQLDFNGAEQSLKGDSKFIPLANLEPGQQQIDPIKMAQSKINTQNIKAVGLEKLVPNLPGIDEGPELTAGMTDGQSLNVHALNYKNEQRLKMLEQLESANPNDELAKLDSLLFNFQQ